MYRKFLIIVGLLLLPVSLSAQVTVTGNLKTVLSENLGTKSFVRFRLRNYKPNVPRVVGSGIVVQRDKEVKPDSNGLVSTSLYGNDVISPTGTFYTLEFYHRGRLQSAANYSITGTTFDFNSATPLTTIPIAAVTPTQIARVHIHTESPAALTWMVNHNFGDINTPCEIYNESNIRIFPDMETQSDGNTVTITYTVAQAGKAICTNTTNFSLLSGVQSVIVTNPTANQAIDSFALTMTAGDILPGTTGLNLGSTSARWDGVFEDVQASKVNGVFVVDGNEYPQTEAGIILAISDASAGDTIYLPAATYAITTGIIVNKQLRIIGSPPYLGDVAQPTSGGSVLSGSGITILKLEKDGTVIENLFIFDPTGNASTIGIELENGATGVTDWTLRNVIVKGTNKLGTGIRLEYALRGNIEGCHIRDWNVDLSFNPNGSLKSNANITSGATVANSVTGVFFASLAADTGFFYGNTIEGNDTGMVIDGGKITVDGNHFENNGSGGTLTNISVLGGTLASSGNNFFGVTANRDIVIDAGNTGIHTSIADTLNFGVTHNGTGRLLVFNPTVTVAKAGTGKIVEIDTDSIVGTNMGSDNFLISGFNLLDIRQIIRDNDGPTEIAASAGNSVELLNSSGATQWTMPESSGNLIGTGDNRIRPGTDTFTNLGAEADGTIVYCSDCTIANPCAGSGTGALAKRINSTWICN